VTEYSAMAEIENEVAPVSSINSLAAVSSICSPVSR
jgi:hypothetical protein